MAPKSIFPRVPLSLGSIKLGRLVQNTRDPQQDYFDPPTTKPPKITVNELQNFEEIRSSARASKFRSRIISLLSLSFENRDEDLVDFSAVNSYTYLLHNTTAWFENACGSAEFRRWLDAAMEGGSDVYLVVGYHTLVDARFAERAMSAKTGGAQAEIQDAGGLQRIGAVGLDMGVSGEGSIGNKYTRSFVSAGEQIYAVQYRKLRFRWFSSRSVESSFLEPSNRWKVCLGVRGDEEEGVDDVVEVGIAEDGKHEDDEDENEDKDEDEDSDSDDNDGYGEGIVQEDQRYATEDGEMEFIF